jgi:hypothetical protein
MAFVQYSIAGLDTTAIGYTGYYIPGNKRYLKKEVMFNRTVVPLVVVFLVFGVVILVFREKVNDLGFDWQVLSGGNLVLYVVTILSLHLLNKGMRSTNTHSFLTGAYGGIILKLFSCAIGAFIYILIAGKDLNKPSLFALMGLYLVYSFVEMSIVLQQSKQNKNVEK